MRRLKYGLTSDTPADMAGFASWPMKNVSARLYIMVTTWLMTVGTASFATARGMGISSNM